MTVVTTTFMSMTVPKPRVVVRPTDGSAPSRTPRGEARRPRQRRTPPAGRQCSSVPRCLPLDQDPPRSHRLGTVRCRIDRVVSSDPSISQRVHAIRGRSRLRKTPSSSRLPGLDSKSGLIFAPPEACDRRGRAPSLVATTAVSRLDTERPESRREDRSPTPASRAKIGRRTSEPLSGPPARLLRVRPRRPAPAAYGTCVERLVSVGADGHGGGLVLCTGQRPESWERFVIARSASGWRCPAGLVECDASSARAAARALTGSICGRTGRAARRRMRRCWPQVFQSRVSRRPRRPARSRAVSRRTG